MEYLNEKEGWDCKLIPTEKYIVESGSSHMLSFVLDGKTINLCCHPGPCDDDIERVLELPEIKDTFSEFSDNELDAWWEEMFVDDTEEEHRQADRKRKLSLLLFDACANAVDGYCYLYSDINNG